MKIRRYTDADCEVVSKLFYETVHSVNANDYNEKQLNAWACDCRCLAVRHKDLEEQFTLIAEINGETVGFGSIDKSGWLDLLFVHKNFQRQGVAAALCDELEKGFAEISTFASVTAKPFLKSGVIPLLKLRKQSGVALS